MRGFVLTVLLSLLAATAYGEPLTRASHSICDLIDLDALPDEAYGWSIHGSRVSYNDPYVLMIREGDYWELYAMLFSLSGEEEPIKLIPPSEIDPVDEEFWGDQDASENLRWMVVERSYEFDIEIPPSAGHSARRAVSAQGLEATLAEFDHEAFYRNTDTICVGGRILNLYIVKDGKAHHGRSLHACGVPIPQLPLVEAINGQLIKLGITTPEFLSYLPDAESKNNAAVDGQR